MSAQPWHRRFHSDALTGMLSLTLEERGAYQTILDLIYDRGGPVPDNDRLLSGYMGCSIRKWKSLRAAMLEKGKIVAKNDCLTNLRAEKEIENSVKTARKLAENGAKGGRKKAENRKNANKNNESDVAPLKPGSSLIPEARSYIPLDKSNGPPDEDSSKQFWDAAKGYLGNNKASLVAKLAKQYGTGAVADAITQAMLRSQQPPDRAAFVIGILRSGKANREPVIGI